MKEWDALESNRIEAGTELTRNIPRTALGFYGAASTSTWFTLPRE
jgi:hypothetical protein